MRQSLKTKDIKDKINERKKPKRQEKQQTLNTKNLNYKRSKRPTEIRHGKRPNRQ